ncbi:protein FAR1-RELATED SEQUENCE 5-like [Salvia miltiorrhiza]|uniref:protein FAR1-RELATED SEQUENCE 5-like n=1 Tax=Salvia miltiorrhiza TaxID=226208 RepID=UPI0025AD3CE0|nr:protein FAR1-RELATED SEQUENCE 5-like [Salvia miltiorrhiza]
MAMTTSGIGVSDVDANKLYEFLTQKGLTDPSFYWKLKGDSGRLENLFFRDSRCLIDYQHFGDVLFVDSTFKTNKYGLVCVPFIGINHHRTNVMFAIAFLSNEKTESYEWLFRTFLECMYGKEPSVIFSDQDQALMNGVDLCFRGASHRLCQWHINKNVANHFGRLNGNKEFKSLWYRCMDGCETDEQFEIVWNGMIEQYNLSDNRRFSNMYTLRRWWSSAFICDKFCGGLHATSRSEVTNKVLKYLCSGSSSIHEFVLAFERMQRDWRRREFEEDSYCRGMPGMLVHRSGILIQVAELCTRNVFKSFEYEALHSIEVKLTHEPPDMNNDVLEFKVSSRSAVNGYRVVKFNQRSQFADCSCHMWETEGVLCRHLFRVFFHMNLDTIPGHLILNRWRRDCKQRHSLICETANVTGYIRFSNMVFVNHHMKMFYDLLTECKDDGVCREAINDYMRTIMEGVKHLRSSSQGTWNGGARDATHGGGLHRTLRNPKMKEKKHTYRRHKISRKIDHEAGGRDEAMNEGHGINEDESCFFL